MQLHKLRDTVARLAICIMTLAIMAGAHAQPSGAGPLPPGVGTKTRAGGERPKLPDAGVREGFTFVKSKDYPGSYEIYPTDGEMFYVSDSFMNLTVRSPQLPADKYLMVLQNYPKMIESQYGIIMDKYYPDASAETGEFEETTVGPLNGETIHLMQDDMAGPYVRVRVERSDGTTEEFSAAKGAVVDILNNPRLSVEQKLRALRTIPFPLPEDARDNFEGLDREALLKATEDLPQVKKQEFIRMRNVFQEVAEKKARGEFKPQRPDPAGIPTESPEERAALRPATQPSPRIRILTGPAADQAAEADTQAEAAEGGGLSENFGLILVIVVVGIALVLVAVRLFLYMRE